MGAKQERAEKAFAEWQAAEESYAKALKKYLADGRPEKVTRESAIALAELRSRASSTMDRFFKRALS